LLAYCCRSPCTKAFDEISKLRKHQALVPACQDHEDAFVQSAMLSLAQQVSISDANQDILRPPDHNGMEIDLDLGGGVEDHDGDLPQQPPEVPPAQSPSLSKRSAPEEPKDDDDTVEDLVDQAGKVIRKVKSDFKLLLDLQLQTATSIYHPFSCSTELEIATWLHNSGLSWVSIDQFLHTKYVCNY